MARCNCAGLGGTGCACALQAGDNVTVTGTGQGADPWVVTAVTDPAEVRAQLSGTSGVTYNPATGAISADVSSTAGNQLTVDANGLFVPAVKISTDAGNALVLGGDGGLYTPFAGALGMITYTTVGAGSSWDKASNPNAKWLRVRVYGGGGGGAGATSAAAQAIARPGGAGGNYSESWLDVSTLPASVTITVGSGGSGGVAANGAGGVGGTSSFGTFVTALGGNGASAAAVSATSGQAEGAAPQGLGTAQHQLLGERGRPGFWTSATYGMAGDGGTGGGGGGNGGRGGLSATPTGGQSGSSPGGGGGGGVSINAAAVTGGAGGQGRVLVEMFG
ncbi:hypothetical protein SEA_XKCD426_31 [Streptomyces phage Xkcd426]|nr:hypothetical protein SEA_XKCD426_31 [Streptomyces phage Xkcd426]